MSRERAGVEPNCGLTFRQARVLRKRRATASLQQGQPLTYGLVDGGYVEAGDPIGGTRPPPAALIGTAVAQTLAERGYQPAAPGTKPALLVVYHWGEIRQDSAQPVPPNSLKPNDRARLQLVTRMAAVEKIEAAIVSDRFNRQGLGKLSLNDRERDALQFAAEELRFVVITAYAVETLERRDGTPLWQTRMTTRAVGQSMADALVSLIRYSSSVIGHNEEHRLDSKREVVSAKTVSVLSPIPGFKAVPAEIDEGFFRNLVATEHSRWAGELMKREGKIKCL